MSFLGLRRHVAAWLVPVGIVGLCGYDVLTDDPLTDSEVEAFLVEAAVAARRYTPNPDRLFAPTVDSEQEDPSGRAEADDPAQFWAGGATSQSPSDAAADTTPSGPQDSADLRRDPSEGQERSQEP
ncbi:hypothetical protein BKH13_13070 [Actinomyces naeslundii]|uniref:Secreted protein n=1 Tax=Actinomyces naeslundii TaxID=1655 RepID=A0ABX3EWR8_ACTNA|nr:hypothetical protein BKH13_13070 [Actinomyces naeslundii]OLO84743.1 hypothetical protein BKH11_09340 [Actinomyces naeslundii]OLO89693.1 hypothetical protein BKH10_09000 [Actinomyces naeslundii]OMG12495.1 hypothetical protein BKH08_04645 [Actinomyces naeslundii]